MSLFFFGIHALQVITSFFGSIQNVKIQRIIELFRTAFTTIGVGVLALSDRGNLLGYCWIWVAGIYAGFLMAVLIFYSSYYRQYFSEPVHVDTTLRKSFVKYSFGTLLSANVAILLHLIDQLLLTYFIGSSAV